MSEDVTSLNNKFQSDIDKPNAVYPLKYQLVLHADGSYPEVRLECTPQALHAKYLGDTFVSSLRNSNLPAGLKLLEEWLEHKFPGFTYKNLYSVASVDSHAEV